MHRPNAATKWRRIGRRALPWRRHGVADTAMAWRCATPIPNTHTLHTSSTRPALAPGSQRPRPTWVHGASAHVLTRGAAAGKVQHTGKKGSKSGTPDFFKDYMSTDALHQCTHARLRREQASRHGR